MEIRTGSFENLEDGFMFKANDVKEVGLTLGPLENFLFVSATFTLTAMVTDARRKAIANNVREGNHFQSHHQTCQTCTS